MYNFLEPPWNYTLAPDLYMVKFDVWLWRSLTPLRVLRLWCPEDVTSTGVTWTLCDAVRTMVIFTFCRFAFKRKNSWKIASALASSARKGLLSFFSGVQCFNCASSIPPKPSCTTDCRLEIGSSLFLAFARIKFFADIVSSLSFFSKSLAAIFAAIFSLDSFKCFIRTAMTTLTRTNCAASTNVTKNRGAVYLLTQQYFSHSASLEHSERSVSWKEIIWSLCFVFLGLAPSDQETRKQANNKQVTYLQGQGWEAGMA